MLKKTTLLQVSLVVIIGLVVYYLFGVEQLLKTPKIKPYQYLPDFSVQYNADSEIKAALAKLKADKQAAPLITSGFETSGRRVALTFDGLTDVDQMQKLLRLLQEHGIKATFFVDGLRTSENPDLVLTIREQGHRIENYTFAGMTNIQNLTQERMVTDFCRTQKIISVTAGVTPQYLKLNDSEYTEQVLQAAHACGFLGVVKNEIFLDADAINNIGSADVFVENFAPGTIVSVKLLPYPEDIKPVVAVGPQPPAKDKQPGLRQDVEPLPETTADIVNAVEHLLLSLQKANFETYPVEELTTNQAGTTGIRITAMLNDIISSVGGIFTVKSAYAATYPNGRSEEIKVINTTERALSYSFSGLTKDKVVRQMLDQLDEMGITASFFIFEIEMNRYPELVREIVRRGHEIGLAINPRAEDDYEKIKINVSNGVSKLKKDFGVQVQLVKQPFGAVRSDTLSAVADLGYYLIGQSVSIVQSKHQDYASAEQIMPELFGRFRYSLARGDIVHFRLDFYTHDNVAGELVRSVKKEKIDNIAYATSFDNPQDNPANDSWYVIKPVGQVLFNEKYTWKYPVPENEIAQSLRQGGATFYFDEQTLMDEAAKRNIGTPTVTLDNRLVGFTRRDAKDLDYTGKVKTQDNAVFFTFDDWGTDAAINKLLYVLKKHEVKATFYIITRTIEGNKNLLRAIAQDGHDIGSHSTIHSPMGVANAKGNYVKTQVYDEMLSDYTNSFQVLRSIAGDVVVDGKPSLVRHFRPPAMAVSKEGMKAIFNSGFEYIIGGSESSADYAAPSVSALTNKLKSGIYDRRGHVQKGAIIVMHMSDNSVYTAMTIDIMLAANEAKAEGDPSKFQLSVLSDYLDESYKQRQK